MNTTLAKYLWQSPEVRRALKKEAWRLALFAALYVVSAAVIRYVRDEPIVDGVLSALIGAAVVALMWLVSVVRTLRAVMREHGLLSR
jgi:hypothetical protein